MPPVKTKQTWLESTLADLEPSPVDNKVIKRRKLRAKRFKKQDPINVEDEKENSSTISKTSLLPSIKISAAMSKSESSSYLKEVNGTRKSLIKFAENINDKQSSKKYSERKCTPYKLRSSSIANNKSLIKGTKLDLNASSSYSDDSISVKHNTFAKKNNSFKKEESNKISKNQSQSPKTQRMSALKPIIEDKKQPNKKFKKGNKIVKTKNEIVDVVNLNSLFRERKHKIFNNLSEISSLGNLFEENEISFEKNQNPTVNSLLRIDNNDTYSFEDSQIEKPLDQSDSVIFVSESHNNIMDEESNERRMSIKRKLEVPKVNETDDFTPRKRKRWAKGKPTDLDLMVELNDLKQNANEENLPIIDLTTPYTNKKRNTYELDETKNDISVLKEIEKSSKRTSNVLNNSPPVWVSHVISPIVPTSKKKRSLSEPVHSSTPFSLKTDTKKPASKVKMPNFAKIHQRAYEKMEDISTYKKRKEERAKLLLSGSKPLNLSNNNKSVNNIDKSTKIETKTSKQLPETKNSTPQKSEKKLRFAPCTPRITDPFHIPLPCTPKPNFKFTLNVDEPSINKSAKSATKNKSNILNKDVKNQSGNSRIPVPYKFVFKATAQPSKANSAFDFKITKIKPQEERKILLKNAVNKIPAIDNRTNKRREIIKGVRSNKRFELLMNMRTKM